MIYWSYFKLSYGVILKDIIALSSLIMVVNGGPDFEGQKSASIHHKSSTYGSRELKKPF